MYGEVGTGIIGRITNKHVLPKGGQIVMVYDVHLFRPCAYRHIQKVHAKPIGWNVWGNIEVKEIMEATNPIV